MERRFIFIEVARPPDSTAVEVRLQNRNEIIACYCPQSRQWFKGPDGPDEGIPLPEGDVVAWRPLLRERSVRQVTCSQLA